MSRNSSVRTHVKKFTCVTEIEAMCHAQVEPRSTFTLARDRPYIASILKLRDIGNQP